MITRISNAKELLVSGCTINLFDQLAIHRFEKGGYRVLDQRESGRPLEEGTEYLFDFWFLAYEKFVELRIERKLGFDYQGALP